MTEKGQIYVIGDSHIGLKDGDEKRIVAWLDRFAALDPSALYLNGDVFHYFIGDPKFYTSSVRNFFAKLRELRDRGIGIHYVEGNRDFFVKGSAAQDAITDTDFQYSVVAGKKRYFITHGDMINDRDYPYRFWRRISKNPVTRLGVRMIPQALARKFVDDVEKKLARSNFKHKTRLPVELMEAFGRKRAAEGYDAVLFGHFHHKLVLPAGSATVAVLPAWFENGEAIVISPLTGDYQFVVV